MHDVVIDSEYNIDPGFNYRDWMMETCFSIKEDVKEIFFLSFCV